MPIDFDGPNLTITLSSGVTEVDVVNNIFKEYKDWLLLSPVNRRYPLALLTDGGNPLTSIINQGSYIFLQNQFGWRIKPPEESIAIFLTGNLAVNDISLPSIIPTVGAFTAAIIGLQPVTQGVTPQMASQLEFSSFEAMVHYNSTSLLQLNGADPLSFTNPMGNMQYPLNNIPDCIIVRAARGLTKTIHCMTDLTIGAGDNVDNFTLLGTNPTQTNIIIGADASTLNTVIKDASITGTLDGGTEIHDCDVESLNYVNGRLLRCSLGFSTHVLGGGPLEQAHLINCDSDKAGESTPTIDGGGNGPSLIMSRYAGGVRFINKSGTAAWSIGLDGGQVIIAGTVNSGTIVVRGDGKVVDSLGNHMLSGTHNGGLNLVNECTFGGHLHDLWQRKGLDKDNPLVLHENGSIEVGSTIDINAVTIGTEPNRTTTQTRQ